MARLADMNIAIYPMH